MFVRGQASFDLVIAGRDGAVKVQLWLWERPRRPVGDARTTPWRRVQPMVWTVDFPSRAAAEVGLGRMLTNLANGDQALDGVETSEPKA